MRKTTLDKSVIGRFVPPFHRFPVFFILFAGIIFGGMSAGAAGLQSFKKDKLSIQSGDTRHHFFVEIAKSPAQQAQGLMYRRKMAGNAGMLFVYGAPGDVSMWMKNTFIPLDMLFIGPGGKIVDIAERTVPMSLEVITGKAPAIAVLELNGGTSSRLGIKIGDIVNHPLLRRN